VGLGIGLGARRADASRAVTRLDEFCAHLNRLGLLRAPVPDRRLGGWLKMGIVGTVPARQRTLLVGDAAGLVNPLQGEGISPALTSGRAAAEAVLSGVGTAAARYRHVLASTHAPYLTVATPIHAAAIAGSPRRVSLLGRALTVHGLSRAIAGPWALYWNDLRDGSPPGLHTALATTAHGIAHLATRRAATRKRLNTDLADDHHQRPT
jgi:hypothetical protein